ncbi:hypothetical protein N7495_003419 [Penicillium taxi]|uniref:uncharacterized protein n=1 Tax=Penicillium taxi TaxID=168475 RepID=UPI002545861E|nr:uncharacterized protein N7495_003419 [Penicillium taxi]KAJ5902891.1 hypothetical protein N7495_003419 [Penicillium taxi]
MGDLEKPVRPNRWADPQVNALVAPVTAIYANMANLTARVTTLDTNGTAGFTAMETRLTALSKSAIVTQ